MTQVPKVYRVCRHVRVLFLIVTSSKPISGHQLSPQHRHHGGLHRGLAALRQRRQRVHQLGRASPPHDHPRRETQRWGGSLLVSRLEITNADLKIGPTLWKLKTFDTIKLQQSHAPFEIIKCFNFLKMSVASLSKVKIFLDLGLKFSERFCGFWKLNGVKNFLNKFNSSNFYPHLVIIRSLLYLTLLFVWNLTMCLCWIRDSVWLSTALLPSDPGWASQ